MKLCARACWKMSEVALGPVDSVLVPRRGDLIVTLRYHVVGSGVKSALGQLKDAKVVTEEDKGPRGHAARHYLHYTNTH